MRYNPERYRPVYDESSICELCPHKKEGMKRLNEYSEKLAKELVQIISKHIMEAVRKNEKINGMDNKELD